MAGLRASALSLTVAQPGQSGRTIDVPELPFTIGRAAHAALRIEAPGVWDEHLTLQWDPGEGLIAVTGQGALASRNGEPFERQAIRVGDRLTLVAVTLHVGLAPIERRSLRAWEIAAWALIGGVILAEMFLIWSYLEH